MSALIDFAFRLHDEKGVPLGVTITLAKARGIGTDIPAFWQDAARAGWSENKRIAVVREALSDNMASPAYIDAAIRYLQDRC